MKIGFFTDTYHPQKNGVVTSIDHYKAELEKLGHEVMIFCPKVSKSDPVADNVIRFRNIPFPFQPEYNIGLPISKSLNLKDFPTLNIDVIHIETFFGMVLTGLYLARKYNIPAIFTYHTYFDLYVHYLPGPPTLYRKVNKTFTRQFCNRFPIVITPTQIIKDALVEYGVSETIEVLPTGLNLDHCKTIKSNIRNTYNVPQDIPLIIGVGRLGKEKSFDLLIDSFAQIHTQLPDARLMILGDGPERESLEKQAQNLNLTDRIIFTGYVQHDEVLQACLDANLFVMTSQTETQGLVVVEALAMGLPVVAINALGPSEILANNQGGQLVEPDPSAIASACTTLLTDQKQLAALSVKAIERAKDFDQAMLTKDLLKLYDHTIQQWPQKYQEDTKKKRFLWRSKK